MESKRTIIKQHPKGQMEFLIYARKEKVKVDRDLDGYQYEEDVYINTKNITVKIDGKEIESSSTINKIGDYPESEKHLSDVMRKSYGYLSDNFGLSEQTYNDLKLALDECIADVTTPETIEQERIEQEKEEQLIARGKEKTAEYNRLIKSGMCPKCGSFCYGDCEA